MTSKKVFFLALLLAVILAAAAGCSKKDDGKLSGDFHYSSGINAEGFWENVRALDYVNLFDYRAFPVPADVHAVTDYEVQDEVSKILSSFTENAAITDRPVEMFDKVNIDYVGSIGGVEFSGGSTFNMGADVTIGITQYIDDFLEQLIGHMPGTTVMVNVTFPENYGVDELNGKDAVFITEINYIIEDAQIELTDAFIMQNLYADYGWTSEAHMRSEIRDTLINLSVQAYVESFFVNGVQVISIPDQLMWYQEQAMLRYYNDVAEYYGMELEEFLITYEEVSGVEEFIERNRKHNVDNSTYYLVVQAVAEAAGIKVSETDLINYFLMYAGSPDYSSFEEIYGKPFLMQIVLCQAVVDFIVQNAVLM
ncbi:MAG: FKBP-type peptidyl-prolyl cis-trans isomerase [Defluviitaleaceae bacterium]|nr:FKBP-type peptidyl-prolyl cis-trans isomerase [Defluviitaleaceae bacterium]